MSPDPKHENVLDLPLKPTAGDSAWFTEARFGMFIHWGLYALPARHEWVKHRERLTDEQYQKYFDHFDADLYDPDAWAEAAEQAGMKYFVITTKHHEGFCLWDSALTDYKSTNAPVGKDLLRPMIEAFHRRNIRTGLYHSLIDWHHPDFVVDDIHPQRSVPNRDELNRSRRQEKYAEYLHGQVRELLTGYGQIDLLFFDFSYPGTPAALNDEGKPWLGKGAKDWSSQELVRLIRKLQPNLLIDDRLDLMDQAHGWDYTTPEQDQPDGWRVVNGERVVWEACHTFSGSWGYHRDEDTWKSVDQLVQMLIDTVSKGGNLLLNVGPTGRGEFDERALARLRGMGDWMRRHSRSIYGCTAAPAPFEAPSDCRLTYNPSTNRLYVHAFSWPLGTLHLHGFGERIEYAQLLNDASEVKFKSRKLSDGRDVVELELPVRKPGVTVPVIELFLSGG